MITFPCKCGHVFNVPEDRAGDLEQCPDCSRLNDVPTLSDLTNLSDDGTFLIEEAPPLTDGITLGHMHEAYAPHTADLFGEEKDLRRTAINPADLDRPAPAIHRVAPLYDPATGELIRPIELIDDPVLQAVPLDGDDPQAPVLNAVLVGEDDVPGFPPATAGRPTVRPIGPRARSLRYATVGHEKRVTASSALIELCMPANIVVIAIVFLVYYAAAMLDLLLLNGTEWIHFYLQVLNIPLWLVFAHYGCVIEDLGPDQGNELPRPLRFGELWDDILGPFLHVLTAVVICYLPAILLAKSSIPIDASIRPTVVLGATALGSVFFPAVLLTSVAGVTVLNLRPDRVLGVILTSGADYILAVGALAVSLLLSAMLFYHPWFPMGSNAYNLWKSLEAPWVMLPISFTAVFVMHYFCWLLGLLYREHQPSFPWVSQHHVRTRPPLTSAPVVRPARPR